jgi:hypothetical protein
MAISARREVDSYPNVVLTAPFMAGSDAQPCGAREAKRMAISAPPMLIVRADRVDYGGSDAQPRGASNAKRMVVSVRRR